jgi:hypothetical protein
MRRWFSAFAALLCLTSAAGADPYIGPVPLPFLLAPGASIQAGDKLFDSFSFLSIGDGLPNYDLTNVVVSPIDGPNPGLLFQTPGLSVGAGQAAFFFASYNVTVLDPTLAIGGIQMYMGGSATGAGASSGVIAYLENYIVPSNATGSPFDSQLVVLQGAGINFPYSETTISPSLIQMTVQNNAVLFGGDGGSSLDYFAQTFAQVPRTSNVPEASSLAMLGAAAGIGGLLYRRRRA